MFHSVHHTNVRVANLEASVQFYTEILGFEYVGRCDMRPSSPTISDYVRLGSTVVELAYGHDMSLYHTDGMINHFALEVDDIAAACSYLRSRGVTILSEPHSVGGKFDCFFFAGPSGERFEVVQNLKLEANHVLQI